MHQRWIIGTVISVAILGLLLWLLWPRVTQAPITTSPQPSSIAEPSLVADSTVVPVVAATRYLRAADIPAVDEAFVFGATIPSDWEAAAIAGSAAIVLYNGDAQGETALDQAQIFIRSFSANNFLTLSTVDIFARQDLEVSGRPAVRYDIAKKESVASFSAQPVWRNQRHIVTDVRVADTNPSIFYVIAKRPSLDEAIYQEFLASFEVIAREDTVNLLQPVAQFQERITKKPFGIHITPATSPVTPERFSGYHTGVDVEYGDITADVPVSSIANGTVLEVRTVDGYGGLVAVQYMINNQEIIGIYGHLRPSSLPEVDATIKAGEKLAVLGTGGTDETDGERKHLHFALVKGTAVDLRGYVPNAADLTAWIDPTTLKLVPS